jgi:hypothetical protein
MIFTSSDNSRRWFSGQKMVASAGWRIQQHAQRAMNAGHRRENNMSKQNKQTAKRGQTITVQLNAQNSRRLRKLTSLLSPQTSQQFTAWAVNNAVESYCNMDGNGSNFPEKQFVYFFSEIAGKATA